MNKNLEQTLNENYKLIPMDEITDEARLIAVRWVENYGNMGFDIQNKHKLASDIINYAKRHQQNVMLNRENSNKLKLILEAINDKLAKEGYIFHPRHWEVVMDGMHEVLNYANQQKQGEVEFNAEEFGNYTAKFSAKDKIDAIAILLCQVSIPIEDMQDVVEILKENQDKLAVEKPSNKKASDVIK